MEGYHNDNHVLSCFLCSSPKLSEESDVGGLRKGIGFFHSILKIPLDDCLTYLSGGYDGFFFCDNCEELIAKGLALSKRIQELQLSLQLLQINVRNKLINKENRYQGEGEETHQFRAEICRRISGYEFEELDHNLGVGFIAKTVSVTNTNANIENYDGEEALDPFANFEESCSNFDMSNEDVDVDPLQMSYQEDQCNNYEAPTDSTLWGVNRKRGREDGYDDEEYEEDEDKDGDEDMITMTLSTKRGRTVRKPARLRDSFNDSFDEDDGDKKHDPDFRAPSSVSSTTIKYSEPPPITRKIKNIATFPAVPVSKIAMKAKRRPSIRNWICLLCDASLDNGTALGHHYALTHDYTPSNPDKPWECYSCKQLFNRREKLYQHRRDVHKNLPINRQIDSFKRTRGKEKVPQTITKVKEVGAVKPIPVIKSMDDMPTTSSQGATKLPSTDKTRKASGIISFGTKLPLSKSPQISTALPFSRKSTQDIPIPITPQQQHSSVVRKPSLSNMQSPQPKTVTPTPKLTPASTPTKGKIKNEGTIIRRYSCVVCDKWFDKNPTMLGKHYEEVHGNAWNCLTCGQEFGYRKALYHHRRDFHKNLPINNQTNEAEVKVEDLKEPEVKPNVSVSIKLKKGSEPYSPKDWKKGGLACCLCDRKYLYKTALDSHYMSVHPQAEWNCPCCKEPFLRRKDLEQHRKDIDRCGIEPITTSKEEHPNSPCPSPPTLSPHWTIEDNPNITFSKGGRLIKRLVKNTKKKRGKSYFERSFVCLLCDAICFGPVQLGQHYKKVHGSPEEWACPTCPRIFRIKASLYVHRRDVHKNLPNTATPKLAKRKRKLFKIGRSKISTAATTKISNGLVAKSTLPGSAGSSTISSSSNKSPTLAARTCTVISTPRKLPPALQNTTSTSRSPSRPATPMPRKSPITKTDNNSALTERRERKVSPSRKSQEAMVAQASRSPSPKKDRKPNDYTCIVCRVDCGHANGVSNHYKLVHPTLSKRLSCTKCHKVFANYNLLFTHKKHYHKEPQKETKGSTEIGGKSGKTKKKKFRCCLCSKDCENAVGVMNHMKKEHTEFRLGECFRCGKAFQSTSALYFHLRSSIKGCGSGGAGGSGSAAQPQTQNGGGESEEAPIVIND